MSLSYPFYTAVPGIVSFVITIVTMVSVTFIFLSNTKEQKEKIAVGTTIIRRGYQKLVVKYKLSYDWMILAHILTGFIQAVANIVSFDWFVLGRIGTPDYRTACNFQGFLLAYSDLSSALWATGIFTTFIAKTKFSSLNNSKTLAPVVIAVCVIFPLVLSLCIFAYETPNLTAFADNGNHGWCFINPKLPTPRIWNHYGWMVACIIINALGFLVLYEHWISLGRDIAGLEQRKGLTSAIAWILPYPISFFVIFAPISITRVLQVNGIFQPEAATMVFVVLLMSDPIVTSLL